MNNPTKIYSNDTLFRFSEKLDPRMEDDVLYIDNLYENPNAIYRWLEHQHFPLWKYSEERDSFNGKDYNDCRLIHKIGFPTRQYFMQQDMLMNICRQYWHKGDYHWDQVYEFNCFQANESFDNTIQHYPHIDSQLGVPDEESVLNMIVYMDKEDNGGTAVYEGEWITNDEQYNLLYPVQEKFNLVKIIPAKFNRCVIFTGNKLHGGYIDDYSKYMDEKWRYTQVTFFHPQFDRK